MRAVVLRIDRTVAAVGEAHEELRGTIELSQREGAVAKGDAHMLGGVLDLPLVLTLFVVAVAITLLSEINSNTATAVLAMPILAAAGVRREGRR